MRNAPMFAVILMLGCSSLLPSRPLPTAAKADAGGGDGQVSTGNDVATDTGSADATPGCDPAQCPPPKDPCFVAACTANGCATAPAPVGSPCDDGETCTATDFCSAGACVPGGARNWTSYFAKSGQGGRFSAVAALGDGGFQVAGTGDYNPATSYDAWLVRTDANGKLAKQQTYGGKGQDDLVAIAPYGCGFVLAGSAANLGAILRVDGNMATVWQDTYGTAPARFEAVAAGSTGLVYAGGLAAMGNKVSTGWVQAVDAGGKVLWTWPKSVAGTMVAVTRLAASPDGGVVALGYDRQITSSGADLYDIWVRKFDVAGKTVWEHELLSGVTASASGLVAMADGAYVALIDDGSSAQQRLWRIPPSGLPSTFANMPGGNIDTPSELLPGPNGGVHIIRDGIQGGLVSVFRLDANGKVVASGDVHFPTFTHARVFAAQWLGAGAFVLAGDVMLQASPASSMAYRAFVRRVDVFDPPACSQTEACLGDTHGCQPVAKCQVPICDGEVGCTVAPVNASVCKP